MFCERLLFLQLSSLLITGTLVLSFIVVEDLFWLRFSAIVLIWSNDLIFSFVSCLLPNQDLTLFQLDFIASTGFDVEIDCQKLLGWTFLKKRIFYIFFKPCYI